MTTLTKAGRYDLREELGRGAMGVVFHGFDPVIGRDVAVKTMHLSEAGTGMSREELIGRFQTEARAAGLLTHPNIVVIFDAGEEQGLFYITMEFVEGKSLQSLIDAHQLFPLPRVMKLMEQVCSALDYAHQHNVVHRDIKPANLMLTPDDTVKITDFGTAKILQIGTAQTAHIMGTPSYMSPEQVKGKPVDGRSDIFSLGVILYELMTGEKPFPGQNITTVIYKIINEEPIPPRALDSSIHPGLSAVITRALAKDPALRYQSCTELLNALRNYHDLANLDATIRLGHVAPQVASTTAPTAPPARQQSPLTTPLDQEVTLVREALLQPPTAKAPQKGASLLLTVALLGIIGYAGYRAYPPLMDLWQRARETPDATTAIPKPEPAPAAPAAAAVPVSDASATNSEAQPEPTESTPPAPAAASDSTPTPIAKPVPRAAPHQAPQPAIPVKADQPAADAAASPEKALLEQKAEPSVTPFRAIQFQSKLRSELAGLPFAEKVKVQAAGSTLTLSGALTPAEHRELLQHLRTVPQSVRIVDDIGYSEGGAEAQTAASPSASVGWVWVRSVPPNARILVDGQETGQRTPARVELPPGDHKVDLVRRGFGTAQRSIRVQAGQTIQFTDNLQ